MGGLSPRAPATLDLLCRVVDNYGDIGVVYRLARSLEAAARSRDLELRLRLHVDDLAAFRALAPGLDPALPRQFHHNWEILDWGAPASAFAPGGWGGPPTTVLECFASGRPPGLEEALFDPGRTDLRLVVNVEHLTAEAWARDFHLLPSATRSAHVKKSFFMPGFEAGTGGLIDDPGFRAARETWAGVRAAGGETLAAARLDWARRAGLGRDLGSGPSRSLGRASASKLWLPLFSYEQDFSGPVADLARLEKTWPLLALVAAGRSAPPFLEAWEGAGRPFEALALPFLPQETWDELLLAADFALVRGEESLARVVLAGRPFLWQAYLQNEDGDRHQLVKVGALLELLRPHFPSPSFETLERAQLALNDRGRDSPAEPGLPPGALAPLLAALSPPGAPPGPLEAGFASFAASVAAQGELGENLLSYLEACLPSSGSA